MDALDRRILREVQQDCSLTAAQLGDRCGTTESTVLRRLNRLRRDGIIKGNVALVDGAKIGRGLTLFISVRLEWDDARAVKAFVDRVRASPDVLQFYLVTGSSDYVIMLTVGSMEDYDRFVNDHLVPDPMVKTTDTNVVIRSIKATFALPIDDPATG